MQSVKSKPPGAVTRKARRRADASYRNFRIVAGQRGERFAGIAYAGKIPVFHAETGSLKEVERVLRDQIDGDLAERKEAAQEHGWSSEDYTLAMYLVSAALNPVQTHIIARIAETNGEPVVLEQLRWPSAFADDAVLRSLARLAKMIDHALDGSPARRSAGADAGIASLVEGDDAQPWTFKPQFVLAAREFSEAIR